MAMNRQWRNKAIKHQMKRTERQKKIQSLEHFLYDNMPKRDKHRPFFLSISILYKCNFSRNSF